ncbi:VOC family protein [Rhizorhabdus dicambivorans]|uniref:Glyoxalase/bleomycin resistance/extradiol dioxygenase family protein n=1 Tax=Rhizorhabdus dicambivorans TaxID=1850238 RepID=A0A2A4G2X7_9SPHN|nr:VOC family protein [Rhizorhabdus dicambivorans]ATE65119.1 glyoxalase/bleomycin resistance/extradiol dioxygenase family protein [Rhizorhabdus dicambivorans]PCE44392.1 glyoxalase/bleomycin resistance/extradiol dioxygenase family protein [Rhizorhabdus dicambivorans]
MPARLNYVELPVGDTAGSKAFFEAAFGWSLTGFGPDYAATTGAGAGGTADIGLNGHLEDATACPLAVIETDDLEATLASVEKAGGIVTRPIFAFPGGRRFHFREPSGNELAVYVNEAD